MTLSKLPRDWVSVPISELLKKKWLVDHMDGNHGSDYPRSEEFIDSGVPYIAANSIQSGKVNFRLAKYLSVERAGQLRKGFAQDGDVLFAHNATVGPVALLRTPHQKVILGTSLTYYRCNPKYIEPLYLKCYLESHWFVSQYKRMMGQSTRNQVPITAQREFTCILPPLPEQQKIAAILSTWDRAIELTEKLIAAKQKRKQALMQQLLTGKVRFKEFEGKPWTWVELGRLTKQVKRPIVWDEDQLYKLASIRRHSKGMFFREPAYGHQIKVKKLFTVEKNDFLISNIQAAYGAMGLVPKKFDNTYISDQYTVLEAIDEKKFDIHFLGFVSETAWFRQQILLACNGFFAERLRLLFSADELLRRKLFVPPSIKEQRRVVEVLQTAVRELRSAEKRLKHLKEQKKGLMQKLLTGKVRVKTVISTT